MEDPRVEVLETFVEGGYLLSSQLKVPLDSIRGLGLPRSEEMTCFPRDRLIGKKSSRQQGREA